MADPSTAGAASGEEDITDGGSSDDNGGSDPELWLSYGFYDENTARYIADGIESGKIKVKTYKDD